MCFSMEDAELVVQRMDSILKGWFFNVVLLPFVSIWAVNIVKKAHSPNWQLLYDLVLTEMEANILQ